MLWVVVVLLEEEIDTDKIGATLGLVIDVMMNALQRRREGTTRDKSVRNVKSVCPNKNLA